MSGNSVIDTTLSLFSESTDLRLNGSQLALVRLSDETRISDKALGSFSELVLESEDLYPGIDKWFQKKVIPGIRDGRRIAFVVFHQGKAIAESIIKFGSRTKMCSMRVDPAYQGKGIGPFLFAQLANELDSSVKSVHSTAPESLVEERAGLFDDLGFVFSGKSSVRYRSGQDELVFQARTSEFRRRSNDLILKKKVRNLFQGSTPGILMSIKGEYAEKILSGEKCVEIRRRFSDELKGSIALLYATQPLGKVVGDAMISEVVTDTPPKIWKQFHSFSGIDKEDFDSYCKGTNKVSALVLSQVSRYPHSFNWDSVMESFVGVERPPQSYQKIPKATLSFWGSLASPEVKGKELTDVSIGL